MKHFMLGFVCGAVAMGYHTGYIKVLLGDEEKPTTSLKTP